MLYECRVCGYVYDPEIGDEQSGVAAGVLFEALPSTWLCPWCDATPDNFEPCEK